MANFLTVLIIVFSIIDILLILLQESKTPGLSGVIGGGAEQLFGTKKSRGYDSILSRLTVIFSALLAVVCMVKLIWF